MDDEFKDLFASHPEWNHGDLSSQKTFIHVDMDAFFCSVQLAKEENAALRSQPVGIAAGVHSSDISSCNYIARSFGVTAGMYVDAARQRCPNLQILGYDLPACESVARTLYHILFSSFPSAEARMSLEVYSIDEVVIATDTTDLVLLTKFCQDVRSELVRQTGCTASCGVGPNIMLARLATARAKPDAIHVVAPDQVEAFIKALPFDNIHGAGPSTVHRVTQALAKKFPERFVADDDEEGGDMTANAAATLTCADVQLLGCASLQEVLGKKAGLNFYHLCRGVDPRRVYRTGDATAAEQRLLSRSGASRGSTVSCCMNYAVRPTCLADIWSILRQLFADVTKKLERGGLSMSGVRLTLLERHPLASKAAQKFMGRGKCVEVHIPVKLDRFYAASEVAAVIEKCEAALAPLLVEKRSISDEERAQALGLLSLEDRVVWTVTLQELQDIVISDVRGLTVAATAAVPASQSTSSQATLGAKRARDDKQMSLLTAFKKSRKTHTEKEEEKEGKGEVTEVTAPNTEVAAKAHRPQGTSATLTPDGEGAAALYALWREPWSDAWRRRWERLCHSATRRADVVLIKAAVRCAITKCATESTLDDQGRREAIASVLQITQHEQQQQQQQREISMDY